MSVDVASTIDFEGLEPARFPVDLAMPPADAVKLRDAAKAVGSEYRDSVKWKRLNCRNVSVISESDRGTIHILDVGHAVDFDWTWEGALAFRPAGMQESAEHQRLAATSPERQIAAGDDLWSGEVLQIDQAHGSLFISLNEESVPPSTGPFYVRPFEFLAVLNSIYQDIEYESIRQLLSARLAAAEGGIHPRARQFRRVGLPELQDWWKRSWSVLWGPPGTGKTYTMGQQVAKVLSDQEERILVVSTTNRATDTAAVSIGRATQSHSPQLLEDERLKRIGRAVEFARYKQYGLDAMLQGTETDLAVQIEALSRQLQQAATSDEKALLRNQIKQLRAAAGQAGTRQFLDSEVRVVVTTAYKATSFLRMETIRQQVENDGAPFTTVFIDEAGLISRAAVAALSLLASRRVVLVGDSKQLAPISRISRILPTNQATWLASSGLSHLDHIREETAGLHVLQTQHRMHADVCRVVSNYQYDGFLKTADEVTERNGQLPSILQDQPRAIWYVLDEAESDLPSIRAQRGPGNRSWVRAVTPRILSQLMSDATFREANGLFISPFKAQASGIDTFFAESKIRSWNASTVHSQQGNEADIVILDTVNAGSCSWPYDEWRRLVNVGLSRARSAVIVLASRAEMDEPYLRPLAKQLAPQVLIQRAGQLSWRKVSPIAEFAPPAGGARASKPNSLGGQIDRRKIMRPVLSREQQRLCGLKLDGKPRLVRGVAGSGKSVVLAHWLVQTVRRLEDRPDTRIWAVYANRSLGRLLADSIELAWQQLDCLTSFPWQRVNLSHVKDILEKLLPTAQLSLEPFRFDYDRAAEEFLVRMADSEITPLCHALFIDEAQDMGPHALRLLLSLVGRADAGDENSRAANIFYDNAQNIYGRGTPKWADLGLDMRGRSTVMKESFRSTTPIMEFALNVLYRLHPEALDANHRDLVARGLIEQAQRGESDWWCVRHTDIHGPKPKFRQYDTIDQEFAAIARHLRHLIVEEHVQPADICLLYNGKHIAERLQTQVAPKLADLNIELAVQTSRAFDRGSHKLLATTPNSFKGYDCEVVLIPAADHYAAKDRGVLAHSLYVAMTRARSLLALYAAAKGTPAAAQIRSAIQSCIEMQSMP